MWECPKCAGEKFPFVNLEDDEILLSSFNSNWECKCKEQNVKLLTDEVTHQKKLILNYKKDTSDSFFTPPSDEFDLQYDNFYSLEPNFTTTTHMTFTP